MNEHTIPGNTVELATREAKAHLRALVCDGGLIVFGASGLLSLPGATIAARPDTRRNYGYEYTVVFPEPAAAESSPTRMDLLKIAAELRDAITAAIAALAKPVTS